MRSICGLVFALCLAAAHAEETAALDFEFSHAATEGKAGVPEMLRRLRVAAPHTGTPADEATMRFSEVYAAATQKANDAELAELEVVLRALPADSLDFDQCFGDYATAMIRRRVAEIAKKPMHLEWKPTGEPIPESLADAPASFRNAWQLHSAVMAPYLAIVDPPEIADVPKKAPALGVNLRKVVGKPEPDAWKHLAENIWGSGCGTGSDVLYHPRIRALLLSFLADEKWPEAAGAVLRQTHSFDGLGDDTQMDSVVIDLLTALGLDWEQVLFGSLLPVIGRDMGNSEPVIYPGGECEPWLLLAARGSEHVVRQCLDLIRWARLDPWNAEEFLTAALGPAPARPGEPVQSTFGMRVRTVALPEEVHREIIAVLTGYLAPTRSPIDLIRAMRSLPPHCVPDLREPLTALVSHRVHPVADQALRLLTDAKLTTGEEEIAPAPPPLRFRLVLNGKPLSSEQVSVSVQVSPEEQAKNPTSYAIAPDQDLTTDENGEIRYSLEECFAPERIGLVKFRAGPNPLWDLVPDELRTPSSEEARKQRDNEWLGPWFFSQLEVHAGNERVHEVALRTADLEVKLAAFDQMPANPIKVRLCRTPPARQLYAEGGFAKIAAKLGSGIFFRRLEPGSYTLIVEAPGAARYVSKAIAIGDTGAVQEVRLGPGRNVRGMAVLPGGMKVSLASAARLFCNGEELFLSRGGGSDGWKALAFGKYTAHIVSTREYEAEVRKEGGFVYKIAPEDRIDGRDVNFVIDDSTPPTLDLGESIVPPEKR